MRQFFIYILLFYLLPAHAQQIEISISEMEQHYNNIGYFQHLQNHDEVTHRIMSRRGISMNSTHHRNPCKTEGLRECSYNNRKHYWSLSRIPIRENSFKLARRKKIRKKNDVRFLRLDSIDGVNLDEGNSFNEKRYNRIQNYNGSLTMLGHTMNLLGFVVSPYLFKFPVKKGKIRNFSEIQMRSIRQMGELWCKTFMSFDESIIHHIHLALDALSVDINNGRLRRENEKEEVFDILIILLPNGSATIKGLNFDVDTYASTKELKHLIENLPRNYFTPLWTCDGRKLPAVYMEAHSHGGLWTFKMDKFILPEKGKSQI